MGMISKAFNGEETKKDSEQKVEEKTTNNKKNSDEETDDYQLTRAFDLILALNLVNKP